MNKNIKACLSFYVTAMLIGISSSAVAASRDGTPVCRGNVCAYFAFGADGGSTIKLKNLTQTNQLCFLTANGRKTFFQIETERGPFRAGPHMEYHMYSWQCVNADVRPSWYKYKELPPLGQQKIIRRHYYNQY